MVTKRSCFFLFWEGITVFELFVYCIIFKEAPKKQKKGVVSCRGWKKHAICVYPARHSKDPRYILYVVWFTFSSWTIDIIISSMWQYYCSVLPQDLLLKKTQTLKKPPKKNMAMSPNKQTRATRGPCHRLSMLKRHRWPFPHRAAKSELPVPITFGYQSLSIHFTTGEKKTITQPSFPKKNRNSPPSTKNRYFEDPYEKTPLLCIPWAPKKPTFSAK